MTNSNTISTHRTVAGYSRLSARRSDEAPMVVTRLSGWIDVSEVKSTAPAWIIPTRVNAPAR
jgi:hypothetical protein